MYRRCRVHHRTRLGLFYAVVVGFVVGIGPGTIGVFFERWMSVLPVPLTEHDRTDDYWWELSMRQVEVSRTLVFDAPRRARAFVEALVVDNLDIGRRAPRIANP